MTQKGKRQLEIINQILNLLKEYQIVRRKNSFTGVSDGFMFQFQKELAELAEEIERRHCILSDNIYCKLCGRLTLFMPDLPTTIGGVGSLKTKSVSEWYESRSLSRESLCRECEAKVIEQVNKRVEIINKCIDDMQREREHKRLIKQCKLILENAEYLQELENESILTIEPPSADLIKEYSELLSTFYDDL